MDPKETEITCPCCTSRILVDLRTGKVLRSQAPTVLDERGERKVQEKDWDQALGRVKQRQDGGAGRLDQALDKEKSKSKDLDELFRRVGERPKGESPD